MVFERVYLFANGDLRESANKVCWPAQAEMEAQLSEAVARLGSRLVRAHEVDAARGHGFLSNQREGMDAFAAIPADAPVIVAEAVWQYSHHVLPGLIYHKGPILTVANWSGQWPGLVGMLNLNGSLTKAGVPYATLWSEEFTDDYFRAGLKTWLEGGEVVHDDSHVTELAAIAIPERLERIASEIAADMLKKKRIMGIFDEGCMGMFNAIVPDHLLNPLGIFKERLSQSVLYHETLQVPEAYGEEAFAWLVDKGVSFDFDKDEASALTKAQVKLQLRMYAAAARIAERFSCDVIGIQYQQGLKDLLPASDLAEGLLNNDERPEVLNDAGVPIRPGRAITHFNEVDECAGIDGLLTDQVHRALGQPAENTLHDLRWGDVDRTGKVEGFIWVFEISGAVPAAHNIGGYQGSHGYLQPAMYFPFGGSTLSGVSKPGPIVWSRLYIAGDRLHLDIGLADVVALDEAETGRRLESTNREWPIMHGRLRGVSQTQMMGRHKANHIHVAYGHNDEGARDAALAKAALARNLGILVHWCGDRPD
jgi:L-fucose isomerase-like protein